MGDAAPTDRAFGHRLVQTDRAFGHTVASTDHAFGRAERAGAGARSNLPEATSPRSAVWAVPGVVPTDRTRERLERWWPPARYERAGPRSEVPAQSGTDEGPAKYGFAGPSG
ncbi:hypothetical protein GCM10009583_13640 [Ornithinicoccus hortensis]